MKPVKILHCFPDDLAALHVQRILAAREALDAERFELHFASVRFSGSKTADCDAGTADVRAWGAAWSHALWRGFQDVHRLGIHMVHVHGEKMLSWGRWFAELTQLPLRVVSLAALPADCERVHEFDAVSLPEIPPASMPCSGGKAARLINPIAFPETSFSWVIAQKRPLDRLEVSFESLGMRQEIPSALSFALSRARERFSNILLRERLAFSTNNASPPNPEHVWRVHFLDLTAAPPERIVLRLLECWLQGVFVFVSDNPPLLPQAVRKIIEAHHLICDMSPGSIGERMGTLLTSTAASEEILLGIQREVYQQFSFERHWDFWRLQYEDLIEHSNDARLGILRLPVRDPNYRPRLLSDAEFLDLLQCPRCQRPLTATITEQRDGHLWHGQLDCSCGAQYAILRGIPRFAGAARPSVTPTAVSPETYFRRHFIAHRRTSPQWVQKTLLPLERFLQPGNVVLDLSAEGGQLAQEISRSGTAVVALEWSDDIDRLAERFAHVPSIRWVQGDPRHPPFRGQAFDHVIHSSGSFDLASPEGDVTTWLDLARPDGSLTMWLKTLPILTEREFGHLRSVCRSLPLPMISALASCMALGQSLMMKGSARFADLWPEWFRLLAFQRMALPDPAEARKWALGAGAHDLKILSLPPLGFSLFMRRREAT